MNGSFLADNCSPTNAGQKNAIDRLAKAGTSSIDSRSFGSRAFPGASCIPHIFCARCNSRTLVFQILYQSRDGALNCFTFDLHKRRHQRSAVFAGAELVEYVGTQNFRIVRHLAQRVLEKVLGPYRQRRGNLVQASSSNAVCAVFIFLYLLRRDVDLLSQF